MKAIIPAAGLGTRFLPATKSIPKEMLPIVDQPTLLYIVEECVNAGIHDIVMIAGRGKSAIEDFFDCSYELEDTLMRTGRKDLLNRIQRLRDQVNIISVRQKQALGLGHAVWCGKPVVGNDAFAVLLGDEIMVPQPNQLNVTKRLVNNYVDTKSSSVAVMKVETSEVSKYGIVDAEDVTEGIYKIKSVTEKPSQETAPSQLALPGRYVFSPTIFDSLQDLKPGKNGEIQLTDAMTETAQNDGMYGCAFSDRRYDAGDKFGYLQANVELALQHPELGPKMKNYIQTLSAQL